MPKNQGQRLNASNRTVPTELRTDTHTSPHTDATKRIISRATQSITMRCLYKIADFTYPTGIWQTHWGDVSQILSALAFFGY